MLGAIVLLVICRLVRSIFADCLHPVMATKAVAGDAGMIEVCRYPGRSRMAIVAVIAAGNM